MNNHFLDICKVPNINSKIIKDYFNSNKQIDLNYTAYNYIFNTFVNSDINNIKNNIESIKFFIKYLNKDSILVLSNEINKKTHLFNNNKNIYSSLKILLIYCNKYLLNDVDIINKKKINALINNIKNTSNIKKILLYVKRISYYFNQNKNENINYNELISVSNNIIYNKKIIKEENILSLLNLINKCKKERVINNTINDLEKILSKVDDSIYNYVYFLNNNNNLLIEKEKTLDFVLNLGFIKKNFKEIDNLNLKRGFIQGLSKNNKDYILKYQPNKSVMELVLNCHLKSENKKYFLIPELIFINNDNSYFYIIEKYNTDLYKYFNILDEKNKIMKFSDILQICIFIINSITILHKNNIIHSDLKLENIVLNNINDMRIIDFDVGLYNTIPKKIEPLPEKYIKVFNNKKPRGTRIYMIKDKEMSFNNDIYSFGVILLMLLYKSVKLMISINKKILKENTQQNKKILIKYQSLLKKINDFKDTIEDNKIKIKMLDLLEDFLTKNKKNNIFFDNNFYKFKFYKELIIDCINNNLEINKLNEKYEQILFM